MGRRPPQSEPRGHNAEASAALQSAIASLRTYNPDFVLTAEVVAILRVFFEALGPDAQDTVALRTLVQELERLDPHGRLVDTQQHARLYLEMRRHAAAESESEGDTERLDFHAFCAWVMRWKELNPKAVEQIYSAWAHHTATLLDAGVNDGMFGIPPLTIDTGTLPSSASLLQLLLEQRAAMEPTPAPPIAPSDDPIADLARIGRLRVEMDTKEDVEDAEEDEEEDSADWRSPEFSRENTSVLNPSAAIDHQHQHPLPISIAPVPPSSAAAASSSIVVAAVAPLPHNSSVMTVSKSFLAGGIAGITAKSLLAPVDRVKILFQVHETRTFSFRNAYNLAREIVAQDGARALFRGNLLNILRVVPYAGVQHSSFDYFRRRFHAFNRRSHPERGNKLTNTQLVTAGSLAGALSLVMAYPVDIVRARYMVQQGPQQYRGLYEAVRNMYQMEGARGFSRGLLPSLLGTLPYTGIGFGLNEKFKHWMLEFQQAQRPNEPHHSLHPLSKFVCSYFAACIAQTSTLSWPKCLRLP